MPLDLALAGVEQPHPGRAPQVEDLPFGGVDQNDLIIGLSTLNATRPMDPSRPASWTRCPKIQLVRPMASEASMSTTPRSLTDRLAESCASPAWNSDARPTMNPNQPESLDTAEHY